MASVEWSVIGELSLTLHWVSKIPLRATALSSKVAGKAP